MKNLESAVKTMIYIAMARVFDWFVDSLPVVLSDSIDPMQSVRLRVLGDDRREGTADTNSQAGRSPCWPTPKRSQQTGALSQASCHSPICWSMKKF